MLSFIVGILFDFDTEGYAGGLFTLIDGILSAIGYIVSFVLLTMTYTSNKLVELRIFFIIMGVLLLLLALVAIPYGCIKMRHFGDDTYKYTVAYQSKKGNKNPDTEVIQKLIGKEVLGVVESHKTSAKEDGSIVFILLVRYKGEVNHTFNVIVKEETYNKYNDKDKVQITITSQVYATINE